MAARLAVRGGERRSLDLKARDVVTVRDPQGLQMAHLFAPADAALALPPSARPLAGGGVNLFCEDSPPGATATFRTETDVVCVLAAPGKASTPAEQLAPTDLEVVIENRGAGGWDAGPLAEPKAEFLVKAGTATAY
jgi:aminomethyltransferase